MLKQVGLCSSGQRVSRWLALDAENARLIGAVAEQFPGFNQVGMYGDLRWREAFRVPRRWLLAGNHFGALRINGHAAFWATRSLQAILVGGANDTPRRGRFEFERPEAFDQCCACVYESAVGYTADMFACLYVEDVRY